jgi:cytoskeletal protein CcmA (bactofilin family)
MLNVKSKAHIKGEVITGKLSVEPGAEFSASCIMRTPVKQTTKPDEQQPG